MSLLSPRLQLRVAQKQILTPGLVQMVTVLQLNRLELKEMITQEIVKNPVLEESSEDAGEETAYDNHLADTATETYDRELDYTLEENSEHVLADIDAALKRIEEGTYGICTNCGEPIAVEHLEALPWATLCIDCKRDRERR